MKTFMLLLLSVCSLNASDIRVVGTSRVDLSPIHEWAAMNVKERPKERPMNHWKEIHINTLQATAPWPTCYITVSKRERKSVYLKNIPAEAVQYVNQLQTLESRQKELSAWIFDETKRLRLASETAMHTDSDSVYYQRVQLDNANLRNKKDDLSALNDQIEELKSKEESTLSDLAMFTGQIYNKLEVWDIGAKQKF